MGCLEDLPKNIWARDETALSFPSLLSIFFTWTVLKISQKIFERWNSTCTRAFPFWPWLWLQDGWACRWRKKKCAVAQVGDENSRDSTMGYVVQVFLGDCVNFPHFWLRLTLPFVIFGELANNNRSLFDYNNQHSQYCNGGDLADYLNGNSFFFTKSRIRIYFPLFQQREHWAKTQFDAFSGS